MVSSTGSQLNNETDHYKGNLDLSTELDNELKETKFNLVSIIN